MMWALPNSRVEFLLPLLFLLTFLNLPSDSTALSITCSSGAPYYVPLNTAYTLRCTYESEYPLVAIRLDGPPGKTLAMIILTFNHTLVNVPGLAISHANDKSIILTFKNFTETQYLSNYALTITDQHYRQIHEIISIQRAELPVVSLATDTVENSFSAVDESITVICNVTGGIPKATLTWTLDGVDITANATSVDIPSKNGQSSSLTFFPTKLDQDVELKCSASNEATRLLGVENVEEKKIFRFHSPPSKTSNSSNKVGFAGNHYHALTNFKGPISLI